MSKGFIYLLECSSDWESTYKIGYTRNHDIKKRISNLQTGNKDKIKCVYMFESIHGRKVETYIHNLYSHKRKTGEWFSLDLNDVVIFKDTCKKIEDNITLLENFNNPFL